MASGKSCYLTTVDGQELVDFLGEYTAGIYGHNHPTIRQAIEDAMNRGWNYGAHNQKEVELAKIVCRRFPSIQRVRFVNSGTEANMMALATALVFTGKKKILVFNKGYHGSTISGRQPTGKPSINLPHEFVLGTYNDMMLEQNVVSQLPPNSLAAILVEPALGSGGCFQARNDWIQLLRRIADQQNALLIFDEVMTSRLAYNGFHTTYDVKADLMTLGKWVGGGMSFGAFGGREDIMSLYDPRKGQLDHPGTFNNNVFSMNAGIAGCSLLDEERLKRLNALGTRMKNMVCEVLHQHKICEHDAVLPEKPLLDEEHLVQSPHSPPKMFIKGVGSLMTIHFAGPERLMLQALFFHHMLEHGIYVAQRGFIALNIEIGQDHVQKFSAAVDAFCKSWKSVLQ